MNADELRDTIVRLGPWHLDVQVTPEVSTAAFLDAPAGSYPPELGTPTFLHGQRERWQHAMSRVYPQGFEGRSFLDCACNCGAYAFWARELGAGACFGFDVREHWIRQARFLQEQRTVEPTDDIAFEALDLYELPKREERQFDVTLFSGILYHIPDPITGLKIAADRTRELLILNTSTRTGVPDGFLAIRGASTELIMSGVYGLSWYPTGPWVIQEMLRWCGFPETRLVWRQDDMMPAEKIGRLELLAARDGSTFEAFDRARAESAREAESTRN
jgi:tRNA (mo5U34)-methyltransferase